MRRMFLIASAALCLILAGRRPVHAAPDGAELAGVWEEEVDGYKGAWVLKVDDKGNWTVGSTYFKNGKSCGSSKGVDAKYADGALVFTQKYVKLPDLVVWGDGATLTIKATGDDKGTLTWTLGGSSGTRPLVKKGGAPATTAPPAGKGDGSELVGDWEEMIDDYTGVWTVATDQGAFTVTIVYLDKAGKSAGAAHGSKPAYSDGVLHFTQVFDKKPDGVAWLDNAYITLRQGGGDKITMTWRVGKNHGTRYFAKSVK